MSTDGREGGYIKFYRSVESSEDFVGMRPDQCWVAMRIAQMANYRPGFMRFRGQSIAVGRGELGHTLETIATRTGATVKVVRTTIERCIRTGFLGTRTGTAAGTAYRILIVRNYDRFQGDDEEAGTVAGTTTGSDRAATGHETGTDRALRERREEGEEGKNTTRRAARLGLAHPAYEAAHHWTSVAWPLLSSAECPDVTTSQAQSLAGLSAKHGPAAVKAAMDAAVADDFWAQPGKLDLDTFISKFPRFLPRNGKSNGKGPQPVSLSFTEPF